VDDSFNFVFSLRKKVLCKYATSCLVTALNTALKIPLQATRLTLPNPNEMKEMC